MAPINHQTGWVKQPLSAVGLDHLGTQAPSIFLYGKLLPGITNVTNRARYYSFYPWFFWAYEKQYNSLNLDEIVKRYRSADCLFTLIAIWHSHQTDQNENRHGIGMTGRDSLFNHALPILKTGKEIHLSKYSTRDDGTTTRYFKNKYGGFGQYYAGPFKDLGLFDGNSRDGFQCTVERAHVVAKAMDDGVDRKLFFKTIEDDVVTPTTLEELYKFCPCHLSSNTPEQNTLIDIFFDRNNIYEIEGKQRRETLWLIMNLISQIEQSSEPVPMDHHVFRGVVYSGCLPNKETCMLPSSLQVVQEGWGIYQKNEILSIALQGLFWVVLRILQESDIVFFSSEEFVKSLSKSKIVSDSLGELGKQTISDFLKSIDSSIPDQSEWQSPEHEVTLARKVEQLCKKQATDETYVEIIRASMNLLLILMNRDDLNSAPYGSFKFPDHYFSYYPLNLETFRKNSQGAWKSFTLKELFEWIVNHWGIENHLHIALRKLHRDKRNTFRVQPTDEGLKVVDTPTPVYTNPRFNQGIQILKDIGLVGEDTSTGVLKITADGEKIMEENYDN